MHDIAGRGMGHAKDCGFNVPHVLESPTAIFEGLRREEDDDKWGEGWRCYCGVPEHAYTRDGAQIPARTGRVLLVFVNSRRIAYNWRWEKSDIENFRLPADHEGRFKTRLL